MTSVRGVGSLKFSRNSELAGGTGQCGTARNWFYHLNLGCRAPNNWGAKEFTEGTPNCPSRGEIPKILKLAWGKAFVEVVAMRRLACV